MSWLPQSGKQRTAHDANDTWDKYEGSSRRPFAQPAAPALFTGPPASAEALVNAFAASNAMASLSDNVLSDAGHKATRLQSNQRAHEPYERNILPFMATSTLTTPDSYYLGGLDAAEREKGGTFVDRLGNEYDIFENKLPPPNKDYSSTAAATSNRHLERCQGGDPYFADRPKKEVKHVTNPAEPRGDDQYLEERNNIEELKGRQTYFNQAGMQESAIFDTGRTQYDGYNVKTKYTDLVNPVEHCWRATIMTDQKTRAEPNGALRASPSAEVYLRRKEGAASFHRKPMPAPATVRAGQARLALPFVGEATPRAQARCEGGERQAAHCLYGPNATGRTLDVRDKAEVMAMENRRADAKVSLKTANPVVIVDRVDVQSIESLGNASLPLAFSASLADTTRNDTQRNNSMVAPKPTRDWNLIRKIAEDLDRQGEDDTEVSELTQFASSTFEGNAVIGKDSDHRIRDDVVENTGSPRVEDVVHAPPKKPTLTREGRDETKQTYDALQQMSDAGQWRDGVTVNDDRTTAADIVRHKVAAIGERFESIVELQREDVAPRDDARASSHVPQTATREAVTLDDERAHYDVQMAPAREIGGVARPRMPIREDERAMAARTGLAVSEVADIKVRPRNDALIPNRTFANRAIEPLKAYDQGGRIEGAVSLTRVEQGLSRCNHADAANIGGAHFTDARDDRPVEARGTYGSLPTTKNQTSHAHAGMRATPTASTSLAGLRSSCRLESKSVQASTARMARPESGLQKHDRSTPTRAMTPGFGDNARWTPTLQQNGQSRNAHNERSFIGGDTRFRTSTPDMRAGSTRET